jgi:hypothetical protein
MIGKLARSIVTVCIREWPSTLYVLDGMFDIFPKNGDFVIAEIPLLWGIPETTLFLINLLRLDTRLGGTRGGCPDAHSSRVRLVIREKR